MSSNGKTGGRESQPNYINVAFFNPRGRAVGQFYLIPFFLKRALNGDGGAFVQGG